jgi:hypothetical protein
MQVLSLLPLPDKFVGRSVCKKWFCAAREVLKDQEDLILSPCKLSRDSKRNPLDAMHFLRKPKAAAVTAVRSSLMDFWDQDPLIDVHSREKVKLLSHLKNLKRITYCNDDYDAEVDVWNNDDEYEANKIRLKTMWR